MFITALPQSNAEVERTLSRLNNNKNKLMDCLTVGTSEAIIMSSKNFPGNFEVNQRHAFTWQSKENIGYFEKILKLLVLSPMRLFCESQPAGELQGIMLKIYGERCWLILEDIEIIFFYKN